MKNKIAWLSAPYVIWMALVVVVPIIMVVVYAFTSAGGGFTLDNFAKMGTYTVIFTRSFQLALVATIVCLLLGYPLAYVMAKEGPGFQRMAMVLIMLPMWVNFLLRTYAWMAILENNGILNNFFEAIGLFDFINNLFGTDFTYFRMIRTQGAVVLGMVYNYLPFMVLPIYSVIIKLDHSLLEAARDLGCNSFSVLKRVVLPLSLPGIISGITMVLIPSISTFYISQKLGNGKFFLIGDAIEGQYVANNLHFAAAIAFILMLILLAAMALMKRGTNRRVYGGV